MFDQASGHYTGRNSSLTCTSSFLGSRLDGVTASFQFTNPQGALVMNTSRTKIQDVMNTGDIFSQSILFRPISASADTGMFVCTASIIPTMINSFVMSSPSDTDTTSITVTSKE